MDSDRISDEVREQLIALGHRNAVRAIGPLFLAVVLGFLLLTYAAVEGPLTAWAIGTCAVVTVRALLLRRLRDAAQLSPALKCRLATAMNLCIGGAFGAVLLFFPEVGLFQRAMLTALLLGVSSGAISSNLGYPPLFLSYTLPMLGTLAALWMFNPGTVAETPLALCIGLAVALVAVTHSLMAREVFDAFVLSIESSRALRRQTARLEEQAMQLSDALERAEAATCRAELLSASKTRFIAAASHDLRQPVHVLNLYGVALAKAELAPGTRDVAEDMGRAVASLSSQLDALLDLSELDGGKIEPERRSVDLAALTSSLARELGKLAEEKGLAFVDTVDESLHVSTDPTLLSQIIRNLGGNAIKFTHEGSVTLAAERRGEEVVLSVTDTGIGIDEEDSTKVFEEFYQVSNPNRDKRSGVGLGLSIVERLARALGHQVELRSRPGVGTRVGVVMPRDAERATLVDAPLIDAPLVGAPCAEGAGTGAPHAGGRHLARLGPVRPAPARPARPRSGSPSSISPRRGPAASLPALHVHVVDDDPAVRRSMRSALESLGAEVTLSDSTSAALARLEGCTPSAVLIDLDLGAQDSGLHLVDALTRSHPTVPLAILTGEPVVGREVTEAYPDLVLLHKPLSEAELLELLEFMTEGEGRAGAVPPAEVTRPEGSGREIEPAG